MAGDMEGIIVTDDELKRLGKRFGPNVWQMGSWNSGGVFGYSNVPILAVEKASESSEIRAWILRCPG
jgi:hypothetical protein